MSEDDCLTIEEVGKIKEFLKKKDLDDEISKRFNAQFTNARLVTEGVLKIAIACGVFYAWGIDILKHMLGISK
mgnify:CR=1 FL=1|tara:strand:+ start:2979 stop:3197 length:219 start_codon:yes stop_codon:yes gene_type:complete